MKCTKVILGGLMAVAAMVNALPTQVQTKKVEPLGMDLRKAEAPNPKGVPRVVGGTISVAQKLQSCDFLLNKDFKRNAKVYLCLFSASWCPPCRAEMPRIAKTYAETLKDDPDIELIHFSRDRDESKALDWAKKHDVKFPVVKYNGGNPLDLHTSGIPHLFIVGADGRLLEEGHPAKLFTSEKLNALKAGAFTAPETAIEKTRKAQQQAAAEREQQLKELRQLQEQLRRQREERDAAQRRVGLAANAAVQQQQATVDGYTWSYRVNYGAATIVSEKKGRYSCAVSPMPTGDVKIPVTLNGVKVTSIGDHAFLMFNGMTSVTIPSSVTNIGWSAFSGCRSLTSVTIPEGVKCIGKGAFSGCCGLTSVTIPASVRYIEDDAFSSSPELYIKETNGWSVRRGNGPTGNSRVSFAVDLDNPSYSSRNGLLCSKDGTDLIVGLNGDINIPDGVKNISKYAFSDCRNLTSVTIPPSVTNIGFRAFYNCSALKSVTIPDNVTSIGASAFSGCSGLTNVTIPDSVTSIGSDAFAGTPFYGNQPDGMVVLGGGVLYAYKGKCQSSVTIPSSVTSIGKRAFAACRGRLESVTIPSSVTNIDKNAFWHCGGIKSFSVASDNPSYSSRNGMLCTKDGATLLVGVIGANGNATIPEGVANIGYSAFNGYSGLKSVTIPNSVTNIGNWAFHGCRGLTSVAIPEGVTSIGADAFLDCRGLTSVTIPDSVTSIGVCAFNGTPFYDKMPDGMVVLGGGLLCEYKGKCPSTVLIPSNVTSIAEEVFSERFLRRSGAGLKMVVISSSVTNIGNRAFSCYGDLTNVTMRGERPEAPNGIFSGCGKLKAIHVPANAKSWAGMKKWQGIPLVFDGEDAAARSSADMHGVYCVIDISGGSNAEHYPVSYLDSAPEGGWGDQYKTTKIVLRRVDAGTYPMLGNRKVTFTKPFYIGIFELTQKQIKLLSGDNNRKFVFEGDMRPADCLTWDEMRGKNEEFDYPKTKDVAPGSIIGKLRAKTGLFQIDLPTSYQFACAWNAGTDGSGRDARSTGRHASNQRDGKGGYMSNHTIVGSYLPNEWGIYDLHGNVWEMCLDYSRMPDTEDESDPMGPMKGAKRQLRGGCWNSADGFVFSDFVPLNKEANDQSGKTGCRIVINAEPERASTPTQKKNVAAKGGLDETKMGEVKLPYEIEDGAVVLGNSRGPGFLNQSQLRPLTQPRRLTPPQPRRFLTPPQSRLLNLSERRDDQKSTVVKISSGKLVIPDAIDGIPVRRIGLGAFSGCKGLTSMTIPLSVTGIVSSAFSDCNGIKSFSVDASNASYSSRNGMLCTKDGSFLIVGVNGDVVIPEGVTSIGNGAFYDCKGLTSVKIPDSVTNIGVRAFFGCKGLTSVTIPSNVTSIGSDAFTGTPFYDNMPDGMAVLGGGVLCGYKGKRPSTVVIPSNVTSIAEEAFSERLFRFPGLGPGPNSGAGLKMVVISSSVTNIGNRAFACCGDLTNVTMLGERPEAPNDIFQNCGNLKAIRVPVNAKSWAGMKKWQGIPLVFSGKEIVNGIEWTYGIIDGKAQLDYASSSNVTDAISIPSTLGGWPVTSIGRNGFRSDSGWRVFEKCCNFTSVTIPEGVMNIGGSAFSGCSNLVSVIIPNSVTNIGTAAFYGCSGRMSISVGAGNAKFKSIDGLLLSKDGTCLLAGVNGNVTIPSSVTSIGGGAFRYCKSLTSVTIPDSVTIIEDSAFDGCNDSLFDTTTIPRVKLVDGWVVGKAGSLSGDLNLTRVRGIADYAFSDCSGLTSVTIGNGVTNIGWSAFSGCTNLTNVTIPEGVANIEGETFSGCSSLTDVTIPEGVTSIGEYAFSGCSGLKSVTIGNGVTNIGWSAFSGCTNLTSVTIPSSVTSIGADTFSGCSGLQSVTILDSVTNIGARAFYGCKGLTSVTIPDRVTSIGVGAFSGCSALTSVTIPDSVTSIGGGAFCNCSALTSVTIPSGVTSIGGGTFFGCRSLTSVTIPSSVTSIESNAFSGAPFYDNMPDGMVVLGGGVLCKYKGKHPSTVVIPSNVTSIAREVFAVDLRHRLLRPSAGLKMVVISSSVTHIGNRAFYCCGNLANVTMLGERPEAPNDIFQNCGKLKAIHVPANAKSWAGMKEWMGIPLVFEEDDVIRKMEQDAQQAMESERQAEEMAERKRQAEVAAATAEAEWRAHEQAAKEAERTHQEAVAAAEKAARMACAQAEKEAGASGIQKEKFPLAQGIDLEMIKCPAGEFMMGYESWNTWGSALNREQRKLHRVKLTKDFMLGKFPVTCSQWYAIMGNGKKAPKELEDAPVGNITVPEMQAFCDKLTEKFKAQLGGKVFRLPTDAEWEYASKGGKNLDGVLGKTLGRDDNTGSSSRKSKVTEAIFRQMGYTGDDHARVSDTKKPYFMWNTLPVGKHKPNEWGFMDFIGNAWEVTADKMMDFKDTEDPEFHKDLRRWNGRQSYSDFEIDPLLKGERHLIRTGFWHKGVSSIGNKNSIGDNDRFPAVGFRVCIGEALGDWNNATPPRRGLLRLRREAK